MLIHGSAYSYLWHVIDMTCCMPCHLLHSWHLEWLRPCQHNEAQAADPTPHSFLSPQSMFLFKLSLWSMSRLFFESTWQGSRRVDDKAPHVKHVLQGEQINEREVHEKYVSYFWMEFVSESSGKSQTLSRKRPSKKINILQQKKTKGLDVFFASAIFGQRVLPSDVLKVPR